MNEEKNIIELRDMIFYAMIIILLMAIGLALYYYYFRAKIGPEQPVHFSHRVHTTEKGISCFFCHEGGIETARSGIPPLQTCMLCHQKIIVYHPEIINLRTAYAENRPVEWVRAQNNIPDFVFFNHSVHLFRQLDCSRCHGNIKGMDRVEQVNKFNMNFCINCHRLEGATTDCFTCHR
jgi:hypothetical protein